MSFYGFAKVVCQTVFLLMFNVNVVGLDNVPEREGLVLFSNHQSNFDPIFLGLHFPRRLFFMGKEELFSIPLFSYIIKKLGAFPVKRGARDLKALSNAIDIVNRGNILAMFPEGTRSKTGEVLKFKSGVLRVALASGCRILPCSVFYEKSKFFRKKVIVSYGRPFKLNQIINLQAATGCSDKEIDFSHLTKVDYQYLNECLRNLIQRMHDTQKKYLLNF